MKNISTLKTLKNIKILQDNSNGNYFAVKDSDNENDIKRHIDENEKKTSKRSNDKFKLTISIISNDKYVFLEDYKGVDTEILCRHKECGHEWKVSPFNFIYNGQRCISCISSPNTKTNEKFIQDVKNLTGIEYTFLEEYKNNKYHIKCRHNVCGHEWKVRPSNFTNIGNRCPKCNSTKKTHKEFVKEVEDLVGDEYDVLGKYKNSHTNILMRHNVCGHEWKVRPSNFVNIGNRCPKCNSTKKTHKEFVKEVEDLVGDEYDVLGKYKGANINILMKHNICGHEWSPRPSNFLNAGNRCPKCI